MKKLIRTYMPGKRTQDRETETPIDLDECRKTVGFMIEVHIYAGLTVCCDEEAKIYGKQKSLCLDGCVYRGNLMVGHLTDEGLNPVTEEELEEFERHITIRF